MDRTIEKKSWIRRKIGYLTIGLVLAILIIYQLAFSDRSTKLNVKDENITIETVQQDLFQDYIASIGNVEPIQTIYLDATEGGRVEEIYLREGTMLKQGDLILKLSNDNLLLEISNNETEVARAVNDLKQMRVNLENQRINNKNQLVDLYYDLLKLHRLYNYDLELSKNNHVSKEQLTLSKENFQRNKEHYDLLLEKSVQDSIFMKTRVISSEESVESMQRNLQIIRGRLGKLMIKSPVNGELATLRPEIGEVINYGNRIGTINILDSYKLRVEIDEYFISRITRKLIGNCELNGKDYKASISKIYPEVKGGKFAVDMVFEDTIPQGIRIGQTLRIKLELGESKNGILLPRGGFYQSTGGTWIFVVDPTGKFATRRNIKIGRQNPKYYEVLDGLKVGEKVITSGYETFGTVEKLILKSN